MRSGAVEVGEAVLVQHAQHVLFVKDEDVIEALASHAAEEALTDGVDQRGTHRGANDSRASALGNSVELGAELVVTIADDELRSIAESRRVAELLSGPRLSGGPRHAAVHHALGVDVDDEEREDRPEPDVVRLQEVAGPDGVVSQEAVPALAPRWGGGSSAAHVPLNGSLRNADAEVQQLAADALRAPEAILLGHAPDELDGLRGKSRQCWWSRFRLQSPEESDARAVPARYWFGPDQQHGVAPVRGHAGEHDQEATLVRAKRGPFDGRANRQGFRLARSSAHVRLG